MCTEFAPTFTDSGDDTDVDEGSMKRPLTGGIITASKTCFSVCTRVSKRIWTLYTQTSGERCNKYLFWVCHTTGKCDIKHPLKFEWLKNLQGFQVKKAVLCSEMKGCVRGRCNRLVLLSANYTWVLKVKVLLPYSVLLDLVSKSLFCEIMKPCVRFRGETHLKCDQTQLLCKVGRRSFNFCIKFFCKIN